MTVSLEPLRWLLHPVALLAFAATAQAWINGATVRGIVTAGLGVLIAGATELARGKVTPAAKAGYVDRDLSGWNREAGYGLVEVLLVVFLVLVILLVLFRLA